ncbi:lipase 1 [Yarrowia lipolytica]|uniref:Lipase 1 n=2 Tax=Yarrowia lipolytica TaxID=4952 RepID=LIP1_YARLI|nr:YALI0E10659p [Yarrowia lipolytica CLIB122]Q99156.2 RecName: Full=Lipase 1; Flags: Precursor [Yarrowia lipolytica CLIB122]QNP98903.1 Lipase 1 [Yarrowia lipolytica]RDW25247.1 lipase 1 [Yarrowia lipolytica]RDW34567.1 lipase 1 [Yarrowia lipolytica]RDW38872.1 lipase 1 [Yarrowia lipolytica]RDW49303.1 lipase 1 [Yarrowia lipolytica]|eukprot:XP_503790.1 YALI0E10659p [Yarrowia lipolytica CLIB122]
MSVTSTSLNGTFNGISEDGIEIFKGIKYANIPYRWAYAERIDDYDNGVFDCTQEGMACPQVLPFDYNIEKGPKEMPFDEFECSNLMITRPQGATNLPVFVWIHGGGNLAGNGYCSDHNPVPFVKHSIVAGRPVLHVMIEYRLSAFGYLAVPDTNGNWVGNWGARDQYTALQWISKHIVEFGGDPSQITIGGESAGSIGLHALMVHESMKPKEECIIHNVILSSGTMDRMGTGTISENAFKPIYDGIKTLVGDINTCSADELLEAQIKAGLDLGFYLQDDFFPPDWRNVRFKVSRVLLSDVIVDGTNFKNKINPAVRVTPENDFDHKVFKLYNISTEDTWEDYHYKMMLFKGDETFIRGNQQLELLFEQENIPVWRQLFDQIHPNDPSRLCHHAVDLYYMWDNWEMPEDKHAVARQYQDTLTKFVYGQDPWPVDKLHYVHDNQFEILDKSQFGDFRNVPALKFLLGFSAEELGELTKKYTGEGHYTL